MSASHLLQIGPVVLETILKSHLNKFKSILPKFGCNQPSGTGKQDEFWKVYTQTDGKTDRQTTDSRGIRNIFRIFIKGELKFAMHQK